MYDVFTQSKSIVEFSKMSIELMYLAKELIKRLFVSSKLRPKANELYTYEWIVCI